MKEILDRTGTKCTKGFIEYIQIEQVEALYNCSISIRGKDTTRIETIENSDYDEWIEEILEYIK